MAQQLALDLRFSRSNLRINNFYANSNQLVIDNLTQLISDQPHERMIYLHGSEACGKTHLLQAYCQAWSQQHFYLDLTQSAQFPATILNDCEQVGLVALDNIEQLDASWQEALFHFYNRAMAAKTRVLFAANCSPQQLNYTLADLKSRLCQTLILQVHPLTDEEKILALQLHANARGFELAPNVGAYLLRRYSRKMSDLIALLQKIDELSLQQQRHVTIPFLKQLL
jgi:DnaA family protein